MQNDLPVSFIVDGSRGVLTVQPYTGTGSAVEAAARLTLGSVDYPIDLYFESEVWAMPGTGVVGGQVNYTFGNPGFSSTDGVVLDRSPIGFVPSFYLKPAGTMAVYAIPCGTIAETSPFAVRVRIEETTIYANVWQLSDPEPAGWQLSETRSGAPQSEFQVRPASPSTNITLYLDNLQLLGFNGPCTYRTAYPYVDRSLKASFNNAPITVLELGDGIHFDVPGHTGDTVQVSYQRRDAYEGDATGLVDPGGSQYDPGGGGAGTWRWPCSGAISQEYGCTPFGGTNGYSYGDGCPIDAPYWHDGIDITNASGTELRAPHEGVIEWVGWQENVIVNAAYEVSIRTDDGYLCSLFHLLPIAHVVIGQRVQRGELVGFMGSTGNSTGTHVHFEVHHGGDEVNPRALVSGNP